MIWLLRCHGAFGILHHPKDHFFDRSHWYIGPDDVRWHSRGGMVWNNTPHSLHSSNICWDRKRPKQVMSTLKPTRFIAEFWYYLRVSFILVDLHISLPLPCQKGREKWEKKTSTPQKFNIYRYQTWSKHDLYLQGFTLSKAHDFGSAWAGHGWTRAVVWSVPGHLRWGWQEGCEKDPWQTKLNLGGGNSNILGGFTPKIGVSWSIFWRAYFSDGLVKPPTSKLDDTPFGKGKCPASWNPHIFQCFTSPWLESLKGMKFSYPMIWGL